MNKQDKILLGQRIKEMRQKKQMSATTLADKADVAKSSLSDWEKGKTSPSADALFRICIALECNFYDIYPIETNIQTMSNLPFAPIQKIKIPVLGNVACGQPIFAEEDLECYIDAIDNIKADFALWAKGDSMIEARINDGDLVFIKQQEMVENGEIAAVLIENEATLKKVFYEPNKNRLMLVSANRKYQPFIYEGEELERIKILGKAVAFQSNL